jgi:hypothetical protein
MRYEVHFQKDQSVKETTDNLEQAKATARAMCNWNMPCDVFDTQTWLCVFDGKSYRDTFRPVDAPLTVGFEMVDEKLVFFEVV